MVRLDDGRLVAAKLKYAYPDFHSPTEKDIKPDHNGDDDDLEHRPRRPR